MVTTHADEIYAARAFIFDWCLRVEDLTRRLDEHIARLQEIKASLLRPGVSR